MIFCIFFRNASRPNLTGGSDACVAGNLSATSCLCLHSPHSTSPLLLRPWNSVVQPTVQNSLRTKRSRRALHTSKLMWQSLLKYAVVCNHQGGHNKTAQRLTLTQTKILALPKYITLQNCGPSLEPPSHINNLFRETEIQQGSEYLVRFFVKK